MRPLKPEHGSHNVGATVPGRPPRDQAKQRATEDSRPYMSPVLCPP